jgi:hypothetical protein
MEKKFCRHLANLRKGGGDAQTNIGCTRQGSNEESRVQGCQIFLGPKYQNGKQYTKLPQNIPNGHEIFPMAIK